MTSTRIQRIEVWRLHGRIALERSPDVEVEPVPTYGTRRPLGLALGSRVEVDER